jgi:hypothetical protein
MGDNKVEDGRGHAIDVSEVLAVAETGAERAGTCSS